MSRKTFSHYSGCLLGGAVGDALGAPVEFQSLHQIRQLHGPGGVTGYLELNEQGLAEFTDDTQMTLFTAEGLLIARQRGRERGIWSTNEAVFRAYLRWLRTQRVRPTGPTGELTREGWLLGIQEMWKVRSPGNTCLAALSSGRMGAPDKPVNDSKGCGGVMRVAPAGLLYSGDNAFDEGTWAAALTHGHPSGYLAAGCLAQILAEIFASDPDRAPCRVLEEAIQASLATLVNWNGHAETLQAVRQAVDLARDPDVPVCPETVERLGAGWVAEEALAIALYCALAYPEDFRAAVLLAVNHSGDSDSTGAICGHLVGALLGAPALPAGWLDRILLRNEIENIAQRLLEEAF
jgi:ADP-ribosylglycohydrolase